MIKRKLYHVKGLVFKNGFKDNAKAKEIFDIAIENSQDDKSYIREVKEIIKELNIEDSSENV